MVPLEMLTLQRTTCSNVIVHVDQAHGCQGKSCMHMSATSLRKGSKGGYQAEAALEPFGAKSVQTDSLCSTRSGVTG